PQQHVDHPGCDGDQLQRTVALALASQRRPSLERAEHRTHRRRRYFSHLGSPRGIEGVVFAPVAGEHMAVDLTKSLVEPPLDRPAIHVRWDAKRHRSWWTTANAIGVDRHLPRIEVITAFAVRQPELVQENARARQRLGLTCVHLR